MDFPSLALRKAFLWIFPLGPKTRPFCGFSPFGPKKREIWKMAFLAFLAFGPEAKSPPYWLRGHFGSRPVQLRCHFGSRPGAGQVLSQNGQEAKKGTSGFGPKGQKGQTKKQNENFDNAPNLKIRLNNEASWCVDGTPGWYSLAVQLI